MTDVTPMFVSLIVVWINGAYYDDGECDTVIPGHDCHSSFGAVNRCIWGVGYYPTSLQCLSKAVLDKLLIAYASNPFSLTIFLFSRFLQFRTCRYSPFSLFIFVEAITLLPLHILRNFISIPCLIPSVQERARAICLRKSFVNMDPSTWVNTWWRLKWVIM